MNQSPLAARHLEINAKIFGLAAHIGILAAGTKVAEYAWRFWGAC